MMICQSAELLPWLRFKLSTFWYEAGELTTTSQHSAVNNMIAVQSLICHFNSTHEVGYTKDLVVSDHITGWEICEATCIIYTQVKNINCHLCSYYYFLVGFEVLTAVSMKIAVFWVVAPCSLVEFYQRFRGPCCVHHQGDEAARTSETLVNFYQTTRCYNLEDSNLHTHRRENLKSY
jgi:hypothetical protein